MPLFKHGANELLNRALIFATEAHGDQVRKGNEHIPYIFHSIDVANEVIYYSGLPVAEMEVASVDAILHDVDEDTDKTISDIQELLSDTNIGNEVGLDVSALSKNPELAADSFINKEAELRDSIARIKQRPPRVAAVKLADRNSNLKNFPAMWSREKIEQYLNESVLIAEELGYASEGLKARLLSRIAEARMMLSIMS